MHPAQFLRPPTRGGLGVLLAAFLLAFGLAAPSSARTGTPDNAGEWTRPFEEDAGVPRCQSASSGSRLCKPVAQAAAVLPDGRVVYFEGVESYGGGRGSGSPEPSGAGHSRALDLRTGEAQFARPELRLDESAHPGPGDSSEDAPGAPGLPKSFVLPEMGGDPGGSVDTSPDEGVLFCSDLTTLSDGRVLVAGGNGPAGPPGRGGEVPNAGLVEGRQSARLYDWRTDTWRSAAAMNHPRHYPGVVELADGKVLVAGGVSRAISGTESLGVRRTETYDPAADSWTENHTGPESETALPLQPRLFLAPNGKVFYNGVGELWGSAGQGVDQALYGMQRFFDPRTKQWEAVGPSPYGARSDAFEIPLMLDPPYDQMTLLTVGGTLGGVGGAGMHLATVTTVDRLGNFFANRTAEMRHPRWSPSGVLLPDGGVFVVGGAYKDEVTSPGVPVTAPELYNPYKGEWREMADQARDRTYHHSALLLPDMRVLVGGHAPAVTAAGAEGAQLFSAGEPDASFEIWSPPYLYRGDRPKITRVQAGIAFGQRFPLGTPEAGDIEAVVLLRTPSPQHGSDSDQRGLLLEFERTGSTMLTVKAPPTAWPPRRATTTWWSG